MACARVSRRAIKETIKSLKGIFAVNKPKNTTTRDVVKMIGLQISDDVGFSIRSTGVLFDYGGILEYSAEGVLVCGLGMNAKKRMTYFRQGEKKYNVTIKLGQATDTHDAVGTITEEKPYDHINRLQIEEAIQQFIGPRMLQIPNVKILQMDGVDVVNAENKMSQIKYMLVAASSICCTDFNPPYVSLVLGSCAHISTMERSTQAIFTSKDALPTYRWSWSCIQEAIKNKEEEANNYVSKMKLMEKLNNNK